MHEEFGPSIVNGFIFKELNKLIYINKTKDPGGGIGSTSLGNSAFQIMHGKE